MQNKTAHSAMVSSEKLNIAVIGSGISGLSAAWLLSQNHNVTVYEANAYLGGHSNTVDIISEGKTIAVDTGFIVYNEPAYPNLTRLLSNCQSRHTQQKCLLRCQLTRANWNMRVTA